ncbi:uncharacterized protein LOC117111376 [Anneissia japonica]|uniref:uncharacterized protein LOC117111376 n=1 Tax=Anneissia japonica TaxID=1529436 RepID=UPI0014258BA8|nr:uncharacterized protein LOC117111376 [Anneissia japonica]
MLISDTGPQYRSAEFREFTRNWGFNHITSSPYFHSSNGLAEKAVDTVLGSQEQRNLSRRTKNAIPTTEALLKPKVLDPILVQRRLRELRQSQKNSVDKSCKRLPTLSPGDMVRMQTKKGYDRSAVVVKLAKEPRSYFVKTSEDGYEYHRNRRYLLKVPNSRNRPNMQNKSQTSKPIQLTDTRIGNTERGI